MVSFILAPRPGDQTSSPSFCREEEGEGPDEGRPAGSRIGILRPRFLEGQVKRGDTMTAFVVVHVWGPAFSHSQAHRPFPELCFCLP
jgi:hypothetical protein